MGVLLSQKLALAIKSIIGLFILVYGTAILFKLSFGEYLMVDGLGDLNYLYLFILCAVPFVLGILGENGVKLTLMSGLFFGTLFVLVHGTLIFSVLEMTSEILARILTVIPISALLIVVVSYFVVNHEKKFIS
ncbi:hypothetical protein ACFVR1_18540 [Psychrobacillus sp. NPDC058041]|uniref:hypothetical protein n=1 Tax=Psychrobacillus sp. NPDC058041 TaxID=3346310 RepID=UPI0036D7DB63